MTEPTVLDYVKSIFKDWKSFTSFLRAWVDRADTTQMIEVPASVETVESSASDIEPSNSNLQPKTAFPWRSLLALLIALAAQRMFEPPDRNAILGVSLYLAALGLGIWAFLRGELTPAPASLRLPDDEEEP